jgi:hypothetical protein
MNEAEAQSVLAEEMARYRSRSYSDLLSILDTPTTVERPALSGTRYQIEMQVFFDDEGRRNLRVMGAIDDFSLKMAVSPLTDDFILAPDGSFIGE